MNKLSHPHADTEYYGQDRPEMLAFLPNNPKHLVDIGCGEGFFCAAVKSQFPNCEVWGVELAPEAAAKAALRSDRIVQGLLEGADLPEKYFDVVSMNDVLEHMADTEGALSIVRRILTTDGRLVLSLPNVRFYLNVRDLVFKNDWEYRDFGILDRTHYRFFTSKSAVRCLNQNGFAVEKIQGIPGAPIKLHYRMLFALAPSFFHWMRFPQIAIVARPKL